MTTITLQGTNAVQLQNPFGQGYTLQNTGPGIVYLDNDSSVSPGNGWALQVGVAQPVNAGTVLWACTEQGKLAVVQTLAGAQANSATVIEITGPVDIGQVTLAPGTTVGITGTVDVAGSVNVGTVSGTVNANIQNASIPVTGNVDATITNASIPVTGSVSADITNAVIPVNGTVDVGTVSGTVNANIQNASIPVTGNVNATVTNASIPVTGSVNANITNASIALAPGTAVDINAGTVDIGNTPNVVAYGNANSLFWQQNAAAPYNMGLFAVADYQSVIISQSIGVQQNIVAANFLGINLQWRDAAGNPVSSETLPFFDAASCTVVRKVRAPFLAVSVSKLSAGAVWNTNNIGSVVGTTAALEESYEHNTTLANSSVAQPFDIDYAGFWYAGFPGGTLLQVYPSHRSGTASVTAFIAAGTGQTVEISSLSPWGTQSRFAWIEEAAGTWNGDTIILPNLPLQLQLKGTGGVNVACTFETSIQNSPYYYP